MRRLRRAAEVVSGSPVCQDMPDLDANQKTQGDGNEGTQFRWSCRCGNQCDSHCGRSIRADAASNARARGGRGAGLVSFRIISRSRRKYSCRRGRTCHRTPQNRWRSAAGGHRARTTSYACLQPIAALRKSAYPRPSGIATRNVGTDFGLYIHLSVCFASGRRRRPGRCP